MKDKNLKRLSRAELLELLLKQSKEVERLQQRLTAAEAQLAERNLKIQKAGDLAHAVLAVNDVMEAAQKSAQQYLDNMAAMEEATRRKCALMISNARKEAERIRRSAAADARKVKSDDEFLAELHKLLD